MKNEGFRGREQEASLIAPHLLRIIRDRYSRDILLAGIHTLRSYHPPKEASAVTYLSLKHIAFVEAAVMANFQSFGYYFYNGSNRRHKIVYLDGIEQNGVMHGVALSCFTDTTPQGDRLGFGVRKTERSLQVPNAKPDRGFGISIGMPACTGDDFAVIHDMHVSQYLDEFLETTRKPRLHMPVDERLFGIHAAAYMNKGLELATQIRRDVLRF